MGLKLVSLFFISINTAIVLSGGESNFKTVTKTTFCFSTRYFLNGSKILDVKKVLGRKSNTLTPSYIEMRFNSLIIAAGLLEKLSDAGYGKEELTTLQQLIDAEKSDLFDVLEYVFNSGKH